jgi:hypothetical protein
MHALLNGGAHFQLKPSPLTEFAAQVEALNPDVRWWDGDVVAEEVQP